MAISTSEYVTAESPDHEAVATPLSSSSHPRGGHNKKDPIPVELQEDPADHIGLLGSVAKLFIERGINRGFTFDELMSAGYRGLHRACQLYDKSTGYKFSTYARHCIFRSVQRTILDESHLIRVPRKTAFAAIGEWQGRDLKHCHPRDVSRTPPISDASPIACAARAMAIFHLVESGNGDYDSHHGRDRGTLSEEVLFDFGCEKHEKEDDWSYPSSLIERLRAVLKTLPERERAILSMRFGLGGDRDHPQKPMTLQEIGPYFNITKERVRQLQKRALGRLRLILTIDE